LLGGDRAACVNAIQQTVNSCLRDANRRLRDSLREHRVAAVVERYHAYRPAVRRRNAGQRDHDALAVR